MTVQEFYDYCVLQDAEDYELKCEALEDSGLAYDVNSDDVDIYDDKKEVRI